LTARAREAVSDWMMTIAAPLLLLSEFLPWSHQLSAALLSRFGHAAVLAGVPRDPSAWQVYSTADILLALVAGGLLAVAMWGGRARRLVLTGGLAIAIAFTIHALAVPPTNGALVFDPASGRYIPTGATPGPGEILALLALLLGSAGVGLSAAAQT
jgi:hypothetical protein